MTHKWAVLCHKLCYTIYAIVYNHEKNGKNILMKKEEKKKKELLGAKLLKMLLLFFVESPYIHNI